MDHRFRLSRSDRAGTDHVLVATDFSDGARVAVARACKVAAHCRARVTVLHLIPPGLPPTVKAAAEQTLRDHVCGTAVPVTTVVEVGVGGAGIAAAARRLRADLIVVGARGEHRLRDLFVGSTAISVVDAADLPVLIVKTTQVAPYVTVLVAVDPSPRAEHTAAVAASWVPDARHVLAHAVTVVGENLLRLAGTGADEITHLRERQLAEARPRIEAVASCIPSRWPVEVVVESGRPEEVIPELAGRLSAGLVVVGTEKISGLRHAILGSVARHTVRHAPCDVLIVHPDGQPSVDH